MKIIPYGRQNIDKSDIDAVIKVLRSDFLTQGPVVPIFEKMIAKHCNVNFAVAVNSATSALHIACMALGVGKDDLVWTTPITFVATANSALYCGASIDFVDIDPQTYNISTSKLEEKLVEAQKIKKLPKVLIPVHFSGQPCDMAAIYKLSKKYGFKIIEDASHAIGGKYKDAPIGNCHFSDITIFSFHPVKIITTGEGGVAVTNDEILDKRLRLLRSHGITNQSLDMQTRSADEIWNYQQIDLGFNYRMTDIQAALGVSQIKKLDEFVLKRHLIANKYDQKLANLPLQLSTQSPDSYSAHHLYTIRIKQNIKNITQRHVHDAMQAKGININLHYIPVYRQPYFEAMGFKQGYCPEAEMYYKETLSIPIYPALTSKEQDKVISILHNIFI